MPFNWEDFLELSKYLVATQSGRYSREAALRSAVSRAYFGAYSVALKFAESELRFKSTKSADNHKRLRECFRSGNMVSLASALNRLRLWRNQCDYDDEVQRLDLMADTAIEQAGTVIGQCRL